MKGRGERAKGESGVVKGRGERAKIETVHNYSLRQ